jgi:endonuclease/exonuclease/phosphatase family metal-dependent hydrolase
MEAGVSRGDDIARLDEVRQLLAVIERNSAGQAIIVAGDFNLETSEPDQAALARLLEGAHLIDSGRALNGGRERNDRVLFRNSESLELKPVAYKVETERFADDQGRQLSDHEAVSTVFEWRSPLQ